MQNLPYQISYLVLMIIAKIVFPFDSEMFLFFLQPFSLFDVVRVIAHTNLFIPNLNDNYHEKSVVLNKI